MGIFSKVNPFKTVSNTASSIEKIVQVTAIVIVSIALLGFLSCVCGCSAGAKKTSYDKSGPVEKKIGEGYYKHEKVIIEKYGDKYEHPTNLSTETQSLTGEALVKPQNEIKADTEKQVRKIIITKEGDKYVFETVGE
jgi:hypothetical protein